MNDMRKFDCAVYGPSTIDGQKRSLGKPLHDQVVHARSADEAKTMIEAGAMQAGVSLNFEGCVIQTIEIRAAQ
jgi:hypothetical protein